MPRLGIEAEGSALGAAGSGAGSSRGFTGAAMGALPGTGAGATPPQPPQPQAGPQQAVSQQLALQQCFRSPNRFSNSSTTGRRYSLWHFGGLQQATFSQQAIFSQQATGAGQAFAQQCGFGQAGAQQCGFSQQAGTPQAFSQQRTLQCFTRQGFSQRIFSQQAGFAQQAGSGQQQAFGASQHFGAQQPCTSKHSFMPAKMSRTGVGRHRLHLQAFSQQAFSQQAGCGQAFSQQATLAHALHSPQPPPLSPSMRSRSSKPNPWLHRATLTRSAPKIILLLIEQPLLFSELRVGEDWVATRRSYGVLRQGRRTTPWLDSKPLRLPDAPSRRAHGTRNLLRVSKRYRPPGR
jgi:hypothetical protein